MDDLLNHINNLVASDSNLWGEFPDEGKVIRVNNAWYSWWLESGWQSVTCWKTHGDIDNPQQYFADYNISLQRAKPEHLAEVILAKLTT